MSDATKLKLRGKCMWAKVHTPGINEQYNISAYSIDLEVTDSMIAELTAAGMKIGTGQFDTKIKTVEGKRYISFKQQTHTPAVFKGKVLVTAPKELPKPRVLDAQRNDTEELIGNGSEVLVLVGVSISPKFNRASFRLIAVQILKLEVYVPEASFDLEDLDLIAPVEITEEDVPASDLTKKEDPFTS